MFQCDEEETFCEGVSLEMDVNQLPETSVNASDLADTTMLNASKVFEGLSTNDVSVKLEISSNEVIMIDESQSTQELYRFVANIKEELAENSPPKSKDQSFVNPTQTPSKLNNPPATNALGIDCEACNEVCILSSSFLPFLRIVFKFHSFHYWLLVSSNAWSRCRKKSAEKVWCLW